jgi:hypothetical protein
MAADPVRQPGRAHPASSGHELPRPGGGLRDRAVLTPAQARHGREGQAAGGPNGRPAQPLSGPAGAVPADWELLAGAWLAAGLLDAPVVAAGLGLELLAGLGLVAGPEPVAALELAVGVGLAAGLGLVVVLPGPGAVPG